MSAGTISIQNNAAAVAGDGTVFTTELSAGDFIVITTGGVTYTLPVKSIESDTALTMARNYNGPAVTGAAWTAMPRDTLNRISAQIAADTAYAIRQRVLEIDNWYQLLEVNGDVTIKMADGSSYTGPSWLKLIDVMKEMQIDQIIPIAEQIRADAQQVADDKTVIVQAKDDAEAAAIAAAASEENASTSESNAASSASTASTKADEAAESARQAAESNPANYLLKDNNLQDLADRAAAWLNVRPVGSTPLAAAAVNDGDAPQWLQVKNLISSGSGGPTMNGVMNYHVGEAVPWETRAYYPPNCLPRDGQVVNRADWPELWAWAQKTSPITDAAWLADVTKRGSYSTGDGSTTFRLPDWNGVQSGSIPGVFFRGGSGAADMKLALNAAPNVTGQIYPAFSGVSAVPTEAGQGVLYSPASITTYQQAGGANRTGTFGNGIALDLSRGHESYGRNNTGEVVPNKISGVWLVRASGGFVAANTSWSVINSLTSAPGVSTTTYGGDVNSTLKVGTADYGKAGLRAVVTSDASGVKTVGAQVVVTDSTGSTSTQKVINLGTVDGLTGGSISGTTLFTDYRDFPSATVFGGMARWGYKPGTVHEKRCVNVYPQIDYSDNVLHYFFQIIDGAGAASPGVFAMHESGSANAFNGQWINGSDERIKNDISRIELPLEKMRLLKGCTWTLKSNGNFGIGFIAQDVEKIFPGAVTETYYPQTFPDGTTLDRVKALSAGDVAAALHHESILQLMGIMKEAITTIAGVTSDESAKAALEALAERIPAPDTQ